MYDLIAEELQELRQKNDEKSKWSEEGQCEGESCHQDQPPVENKPWKSQLFFGEHISCGDTT